jgi:hypothetical protein
MSYEFIDRKKIKDILIKNFLKTLNYDKNIGQYKPKSVLVPVNSSLMVLRDHEDYAIIRGNIYCALEGEIIPKPNPNFSFSIF